MHLNSEETESIPTQMASGPGGAMKRLAAVVLWEELVGDDSLPMAISLLRMGVPSACVVAFRLRVVIVSKRLRVLCCACDVCGERVRM